MERDGPTRAEWDRLYSTMEAGFNGTHVRLDVLNGRVGRGEVERAVMASRLADLERSCDESVAAYKRSTRGAVSVTKRDAALASAGIAIIVSLIEVIKYLGEHLWSLSHMGR